MSPAARASGKRRSLFLDWRAILGIGISALLLYLTFRKMDLRAVWENLRGVHVPLFLLSSAAATFTFWIRAWRWRGILRPVRDVPFRSRFAAVTIGFMGNNLLPARVGEFLRAYSLSRMEPVPLVSSLASLVIERLFDGVFVIMLLFVAMSLPGFPVVTAGESVGYTGFARIAAALVGIATVFLFALVLMPRQAVAFAERVVTIFPSSLRRPIVDALEAFLTGVGILRNPRLLLLVGSWSLGLWLFNAVGFWIAFHAFGLPLPFTAALFFQSAIALAVSVPSGPAFVGVFHGAAVFVLSRMWGAPEAAAGAFAVGFHLAGFIPVTLIGLYYAWRMGLSVGEVAASEEVVETEVERQVPVEEKDRNRSGQSGPD
ncbi:lysylphosphatidylglycerol synthase transmembrane domain-containing protein [soil metagenome]